jgi:hypothetical protein
MKFTNNKPSQLLNIYLTILDFNDYIPCIQVCQIVFKSYDIKTQHTLYLIDA